MSYLLNKKKVEQKLTELEEFVKKKVQDGDYIGATDVARRALNIVAGMEPQGESIIDEDILVKSIEFYGPERQVVVCAEELAELIQAITKMLRFGEAEDPAEYYNNLVEEMADVFICLQLLIGIYDVDPNDLAEWIHRKQARTLKRMEEGDENIH